MIAFFFFFLMEKKPLSCSALLPSVLCSWAEELHNSPAYYQESRACAGSAGMERICSDMAPAASLSLPPPRPSTAGLFILEMGRF